MAELVLTGADGPLAAPVLRRLAAAGLSPMAVDGAPPTDELRPLLAKDGVVVHLGPAPDAGGQGPAATTAATAGVLEAAAGAEVRHLILLSSATVYGAWPDNPVPLTEAAPLRPNPGADFATASSESERLVAEWRARRPGASAAVLRGAPVVVPGRRDQLTALLVGTGGWRLRGGSRPVQALHVDDLASAVELAVSAGLDGAFNVAPDGWVDDETARAVGGGPLAVPLPERLAKVSGAMAAPTLAYLRHPWVVANDRLRREGWRPEHTTEEALVSTHAPGWRELSPKRRQQVALGGAAAALAAAATGAVALLRRAQQR